LRYKKRKLTVIEKRILYTLAVNGGHNCKWIQLKTELHYSTTNKALKRLTEHFLVWLSYIDFDAGPKGEREYSLTPYGVAETALHLFGDKGFDIMVDKWIRYTPWYVRSLNKFREGGILGEVKQALKDTYPDFVRPINYQKKKLEIDFNDRLCVIHKSILDNILFYQIFKSNSLMHIKEKFFQVISREKEYLKLWKKWFSVKKIVFKSLDYLNDEKEE
jgi:hypothetical protein